MIKFNIKEEQMNNLCNRLSYLAYQLKKDDTVECIYFAPYRHKGEFYERYVDITILTTKHIDKHMNLLISPFWEIHNLDKYATSNVSKYGVRIHIEVKKGIYKFPENPFGNIRNKDFDFTIVQDLFNSTILFDRTGKYTNIKEKAKQIASSGNSSLFYYQNLATIIPPIDEQLEQAMKVKQLEQGTTTEK